MARRKKSIVSWNKVLGVTKAKRDFARMTGIPTTRSGRQAKLGRAMGCSVVLVAGAGVVLALVAGAWMVLPTALA
ncbi:hypothetical protein MNO14_13555 [Luteimonas sp. S4-F44]|uniref:hypothetical protein n=1 Tax=Luteimonas sp. S4-F44 TaxID=2925842 RepID=UPI001F5349BE|nr:hypothetical protein [Luteimonas sp. S4-F44]UNK41967.1 hypothetical protein MNO14_13555 [Luteimonas sp. S4-F44]